MDAFVTDAAKGGCISRGIVQPLDVIFVRTKVDIEFRDKCIPASPARLSVAPVAFVIVEPTPRKAAMVVITTVSGG